MVHNPFDFVSLGFVLLAVTVLTVSLYYGHKTYKSARGHFQLWWNLLAFVILYSAGCIVFVIFVAGQAPTLGNLVGAFLLLGASCFVLVVVKHDQSVTTELERITALERHRSNHDDLTRLPNRACFTHYLDQAVFGLDPSRSQQVAVLMLDLKRLRMINDALGHYFGDILLQQVALRLHRAIRKTDMLARLGGDEFGVLLDLKAYPAHLKKICRHIVDALEEPFVIGGWSADVDMHIGVAWYPKDGTQSTELMNHARMAMHEARKSSANMMEYDQSLDAHGPKRLNILSELSHAIEHNELVVHYQPQFDLKSNWICGVEALIRWPHIGFGLLSPEEFIPMAEENGLINRLSYWVLGIVLDQLKAWQAVGIDLPISTNISATNLVDSGFQEYIIQGIRSRQLLAKRLKLEITESVLMASHTQAFRAVNQLVRSDVQFAIDDFGTGYSSLQYLKKLPAREIKIDKSFVLDMSKDNNDGMIIRSTIDLAHKLGYSVTAEGVESQEVLELLKNWACDRAQGFHLGQPMPIDELNQRLAGKLF